MMVMMMAMTPSLKASSLLLFIFPVPLCCLVNCKHGEISMRGFILTLALAAAAPAWAASKPPLPPAADQQLARDMLKSLVEINTTHSQGSTEAAKAIQGWLLSAGFAAGDL